MHYDKLNTVISYAWLAFQDEMHKRGFTNEQIEEFNKAIDRKDVRNSVMDCAVEVMRD